MSIVRVEEEIQPLKFLVITQEIDPETLITTNVVISDNRLNKINLLAIEKGPQGNSGATGPKGEAGKDGLIFDKLPVSSGGTNNTTFSSGNIIYYDGNKLSSSTYSIQNILDAAGSNASVTGVINGSGLYRSSSDKTVTLGINAGEGLFVNGSNQIAVDDTIVRRIELDLGGIQGMVPISKGGTNNSSFTGNRLLYYDGLKISSFPLNTGTILISGTKIDIVAGSGLTGGGDLTLPNGSVVLNITGSEDILVTSDMISLSTTGVPGTYSKVTTDSKGRVVSGSSLSSADILAILGYAPWHPGNDGSGSGLDADLLDGFSSSVFLDLSTHTGIINNSNLPIQATPGTYTKVQVNDRGIVINGQDNTYNDIIQALGYRPVSISGDTIYGPITINGDVNLNSDNLTVKDNIPFFGTNSASILPSEPRGFGFIYGGATQRTGILAYYPAQQELRLVTNITADPASVDGGGAGSAFGDDIDGGNQNAVFLMDNLLGDPNIVLFRGVADNIYISRLNPQVVSGLKRFADGITVNGQISIVPNLGQTDPPLNISNNSNMVVNLNSDLLDGQHGSYYTNAFNMTGLFDYQKVEFNSLEGDLGYIPRFDERTSNPSRTISNSYIRQTGNVIQVTSDANIAIGSTNTGISSANRSLAVGVNNKIYSDNGLAVGNNNIVSGNNSVALNIGSKTLKPTSIAAGNYGYTWANNQFSFGAFSEIDSTNNASAQGQFSTIALYLNGTETNGSYYAMSPAISIPKNKTLAYSLEVLLNKAAGTGAALFSFSSGIIKNSTFRDPNNITSILNVTSVLKNSIKQEIYNDSQQRTHYFHYRLDDDLQIQNLKVSNPPLQHLPILAQNTESLYKYTPEYLNLLGVYTKTNSGNVLLNLPKPLSNGWFYQNSGDANLFIRSYNHAVVTGCSVNLNMLTGSVRKPLTKPYKVVNIIDKHNFTVAEHSWKGYFLTDSFFVLDPKEVAETDQINSIKISGTIYTGGNTLSYTTTNPVGSVFSGMLIIFGPDPNTYPDSLAQAGRITNVTNDTITFTPNFTGVYDGFSIYGPGFCKITDYSRYIFDSNPTVQLNLGSYGYQPAQNIGGSIGVSYCGSPTIGVVVNGLTSNFSGQPAIISPASINSGTLTFIPRRNYSATYNRLQTTFNRYEAIYTQYISSNGSSKISLFDKNLESIDLPSTPFSHSLVCGEGSNDNSSFRIENDRLVSLASFDYETKSSYKIRIRSTDMSGRSREKSFTISIGDISAAHIDEDLHLNSSSDYSFNLTDILLSNSVIPENSPSGTIIGKITTIGGYSPYLEFSTASNSFNGVLVSGSNVISECNPFYKTYSNSNPSRSASVYGTPYTLIPGLTIHTSHTGLLSANISGIAEPISINGFTEMSGYVISGCSPSPINSIFSGMKIYSSLSGWNPESRVQSLTSNSITLNLPFTGTQISPIPIVVSSLGRSFILDVPFTKSGIIDTLVTYSGTIPNSGNYYPSGLQSFSVTEKSGYCPFDVIKTYNYGFSTQADQYSTSPGYYLTGVVYFYSNTGTSQISVNLPENLYLESDESSAYLNFVNSNVGSIPLDDNYRNITNLLDTGFSVQNDHFYPSGAPNSTGTVLLNIDRNHGFKILDPVILNQVPVQFVNAPFNNTNRIPKNNLFDILAISGNKITIRDSQNYLLTETSKPKYFEKSIEGKYSIANTFNFSGTVFHNYNRIFNINKADITFFLKQNSVIGTNSSFSYNSTHVLPISIIRIDEPFSFGVKIIPGSNIAKYCGESLWQTKIFSGVNLYSTNSLINSNGSTIVDHVINPTLRSVALDKVTFQAPQLSYDFSASSAPNTGTDYTKNYIVSGCNDGFLSLSGYCYFYTVSGVGTYPKTITFPPLVAGDPDRTADETLSMNPSQATIKRINPSSSTTTVFNTTSLLPASVTALHSGSILNSSPPYSFSTENTKPYASGMKIPVSINITVDYQDVLEIKATSGSVSHVIPSLNSSNQIIYTTGTYPIYSFFDLKNIQTTDIVPDKSLVLENNTPNLYTTETSLAVDIKPKIFLNNKICITNGYDGLKKTNSYFYNGDSIYIDSLSLPRSYLNPDDQLTILSYNGNSSFGSGVSKNIRITRSNSRDTAFSGVPANGNNSIILNRYTSTWYNQYRFTDPLGLTLDQPIQPTGYISFIGSVSGNCNIPFNNNIYYHSHGGSTASWPKDPSGVNVPSPQTGLYTIGVNSQNCSSGTLCVRVSVYNDSRFRNIPDIVDRQSVGKESNTATTSNGSGYVRPWGVNKKFYFDFSDDAPEINGSYYITDSLDPNTFTLNIPFDLDYLSRSGLVYIIDSDYDIKSNRNPNINNTFDTSQGNISFGSNLVDYYINSYNDKSHRWKHLIHFNNSINNFGGYSGTIHYGQAATQLISLPPDLLKISQIEYLFNDESTYRTVIDNTLTIPSTKNQIYLKLTVLNGAGKWSDNLLRSAPRVNIYGFGSYNIDFANIVYSSSTRQWTIPVVVSDITQYVNNKTITITVNDESGTDSSNISLTTNVLPKIAYAGTTYAYKDSLINWVLPFDIKDLPTNTYTEANGYPGSFSDISLERPEEPLGNRVLTGSAGSITGIFNPVFRIRDVVTSEILASQSGRVIVLENNQQKPIYSIDPKGLDNNISLDVTNINTVSFSFFIPAVVDSQSNPSVSFTNTQSLSTSSIIEYNTVSQRYKVTAYVSGLAGYYPSINVNMAISQPRLNLDDSITWERYTKNQPINLTLYKRIFINKSELIEPLVYDPVEPWALQFKIQNGIGSHRSDLPPKVKLSNLPTIGTYSSQPLEYILFTQYDEINRRWSVSVDGKKNIFGKETEALGYKDIQIYAEDGVSSHTNTIRLFFTKKQYLDNIRSIIYATPNNAYQSNIDIKQALPPLADLPEVSIAPSPLRESTIQLTRPYAKYDKDLSVWEYAYSGSPITEKWDVSVDITNQNTSLGDNSYSQILVKCKGIATDKIYGVGKLNLVELDSSYLSSIGGTTIPFQIVDVEDPYYAREGFPWEVSFATIGGLENPNYPPTILLSGLPSSCSGYNPKISTEDQAACFISRSWSPANKKWSFSFSGLPLCNISGAKPIIITAIDTDTTQNLYLSSDKKQAIILYRSLLEQGLTHPGPTIKTMQGSVDTIPMSPLCGEAPIDNSYQFYANFRTQCPEPTGISGWIVSGSLPSGLNYTISFPGGNPSFPWSNLGTGTLRIYGEPLTFASGGAYPDVFTLKVFDGRYKSATKEIKFTDISTANPPSPINLTVYFDGIKPAYTDRGADLGSVQQPSGTKPLDGNSQQNYWPPAISDALTCTSILPHSECQTSFFSYSGGNFAAGNTNVYLNNITNTKLINTVGSLIYVEFDNNPSHTFNKSYVVQQSGNPSVKYISVPGHTFTIGSGRFVQSAIKSINTSNLNNFKGTVDTTTNKSILGCGIIKLKSIQDPTNYGLFGRMRPSFVASLPVSGSFRNDDIFFTGLNISTISEYSSFPYVYTMKTSNCWETGYIRISGISVPRPSIELFAPPPGDGVPFSYNNQAYSLLSRCAYGSSDYEKVQAENRRVVSVDYTIKHAVSGTALNSGSVSTSPAGTAGGSPIQFNYVFNSGAVLSLFINKPSDKFPTYKYNAIPYAENEYFWIHKGGNRDDDPTQASFPPIIITGIKNSISCMSGQPMSGYSIRAIGGYIPFSGGSQKVPFYQLPDNTVWNLNNYVPLFTGVLQKKLNEKILTGTYQHSGFFGGIVGQKLNISLPANATSIFKPSDSVLVNFSGNDISFNTGIILNDSYSSTITLPYQYNGVSTNGTVTVYDKCYIQSVDQSAGTTSLLLHHNGIPYQTGDYVDITDGASISTENNIILSNYRMSIVSGDSSFLRVSFNGPDTFAFGPLNSIDFYDIKQNYYDQIKLSNITFNKEGEWRFGLSGTPTGLYKDYKYKIFSLENSGLPAFSGTSLIPKKYLVEYPVYINKPLKIILSQSVIDNGIINSNGSWNLTFEIEGGTRPVYENTPEIWVNNSICNFSRNLNTDKMNDNYNSVTDRLTINLSSTNSINYDWRGLQVLNIRVFDDTGSDTVTVNLNNPVFTATETTNAAPTVFNVTSNSTGSYIINGSNNPTLNLVRGRTYTFNINTTSHRHSFWIKVIQTIGSSSSYNIGITNNGTANGTLTFTVANSASVSPDVLYYNCEFHSGMAGVINITGGTP